MSGARKRRPPSRRVSDAARDMRAGLQLAAIEQIRALLGIALVLLECSSSGKRTTAIDRAYEAAAAKILELKTAVDGVLQETEKAP